MAQAVSDALAWVVPDQARNRLPPETDEALLRPVPPPLVFEIDAPELLDPDMLEVLNSPEVRPCGIEAAPPHAWPDARAQLFKGPPVHHLINPRRLEQM